MTSDALSHLATEASIAVDWIEAFSLEDSVGEGVDSRWRPVDEPHLSVTGQTEPEIYTEFVKKSLNVHHRCNRTRPLDSCGSAELRGWIYTTSRDTT